MARPLRYIPPGSLVEVTTRTIHGRLLLRPSDELNDILLGILGRAQWRFALRIHAFVVLSNHMHLLCSVTDAAQLAGFMAFVNGNIAREVGRLHVWRQRFWARRYRAIVVADDLAAVARLRYIIANGCKEGLVDRPVDWPGISCIRALTAGEELSGTWNDRTAEFKARRKGESVLPGAFASSYRVHLTPLPCWRDYSESRLRAACKALVEDVEAETLVVRKDTGRPCVGRERILAAHPHDMPASSDSSPAPLVHASTQGVRRAFRAAYIAFVDAYRAAAECLRRGGAAEFPTNSFPPPAPFVAPLPAPS